MEGAPCTKSTNREWLCLFFRVLEVKVATTLGFLSHPLHLTRGRGQAQMHMELQCTRRERVTGIAKPLGSAFPPHVLCAGRVGDGPPGTPGTVLGLCEPAQASQGAAWVPHCLLPAPSSCLCSHTAEHQGTQLDCS